MNILVTGANGFLGKALTKRLLFEGFDVYAIVTSEKDMVDIECEKLHVFRFFFEEYGDIASAINVKIDLAYHFAWQGLAGDEAKNVDVQLKNVKATSVLLSQLKMLGIKKFIFASTMNTLEVRSALKDPLNYSPRGAYVHIASKINAEIISRVFCFENHIEYNEGIIAMVYGEGNKSKMIPNVFIYSLLNGLTPKLVSGNNQYDLIYFLDVVEAFVYILKYGVNQKSYYIGHNWSKTFKDIFTEIKNIINPNISILFGEYPDDNAIDYSNIDRNELKEDTGWEPKYDFRETIINTANWIKESDFGK